MRKILRCTLLASFASSSAHAEAVEIVRPSCVAIKYDECVASRWVPENYATGGQNRTLASCQFVAQAQCTVTINVATVNEVQTLLAASEQRQREQLELWLKVLEETGIVVTERTKSVDQTTKP